ncbi:NAD-dependent epimerase/dehydratase family protein [Curtobacterium sp. 22159]|uniref:NAD-dependent epimerase/dehydratase family protein n=1 Tax=Curtobacterium sp. 22159 TaxID=3453882 RepID=UPI003F872A8A
MRIFVAGASGVLGRAFLPLVVGDGHDVFGMTRSRGGARTVESLGALPVTVDVMDRHQLTRALADARPHAVVDLLTDLATGDSASNARLRTEGTRNLVDAALGAGVSRIVAASIAWVYPAGVEPADEDTSLDLAASEPRLTTIRGVQALEDAVRELPDGVVLRFGQLYGDGTWYAPDGRFARAARAGGLPATETVASFLHVDDAAGAVLLALGWPAGVWNVVDDEPAPGTEWVPAFAEAVGAPAPEVERVGDVGRPVSNRRARARGLTLRHPSWRTGFGAQ